jgi:hypothetical protein
MGKLGHLFRALTPMAIRMFRTNRRHIATATPKQPVLTAYYKRKQPVRHFDKVLCLINEASL